MRLKHKKELAKAITEAIYEQEHEVWIYMGVGYALAIDELYRVVEKAIEEC